MIYNHNDSFYDGKVINVAAITQEILDWMVESEIEYQISPHLTRIKYSGCFGENQGRIFGPERSSDYRQDGHDVFFEKEEDRMLFQLRWAEYINQEDDPFEF